MWDSELSARIGLWIMELEEYQDPATYQGGSFIPEERRVTLHGIDLDLRSRVADLKIGSRGMIAASQQFDPRRKSTRITWSGNIYVHHYSNATTCLIEGF
ncbi:hypothetical protein V2G26_008341 [Clonostachys chloroleuca]